jgi:NADPH-dependent curcumin reductase CurA
MAETIVVSTGFDASGEIAVLLAKHHYKCRVIAITSKISECEHLKQLGADDCIVSSDNLITKLKQLCPQGIDIYI